MSKTIILIRHAHRDNTNRALDNGLSDKGYKQVEVLKKWMPVVVKEFGATSSVALTSPKKRCVETLTPVARKILSPIEVWDDLDEQAENESHEKFWERIQHSIYLINKRPEDLIFVCSHGDYLPLFIFHLIGFNLELSEAGACALNTEGKLLFYMPSLKLVNP